MSFKSYKRRGSPERPLFSSDMLISYNRGARILKQTLFGGYKYNLYIYIHIFIIIIFIYLVLLILQVRFTNHSDCIEVNFISLFFHYLYICFSTFFFHLVHFSYITVIQFTHISIMLLHHCTIHITARSIEIYGL